MNHSSSGCTLRLFKFSYDTFMIHYTGSHCFTSPAVRHGQMKQCVFSSDLFLSGLSAGC